MQNKGRGSELLAGVENYSDNQSKRRKIVINRETNFLERLSFHVPPFSIPPLRELCDHQGKGGRRTTHVVNHSWNSSQRKS